MTDLVLRLRERIDHLTDERDAARAQLARAQAARVRHLRRLSEQRRRAEMWKLHALEARAKARR